MRIKKAKIEAKDKATAFGGRGLALFVGIEKTDNEKDLLALADKVANLRVFEDEQGKLQYSLKDKNLQILCIPNFTLCADTDNGRRPSFEKTMPKETAVKLFDDFVSLLRADGINIEQGYFGSYMDIQVSLDGPVNIILDTKEGSC